MEQFADYLFDDPDQVPKAALILKAILEARSPRLSDLSQVLPGNPEANYKMIQRFLQATDPKAALWRLYDEEAPFILGDPTEIPRPQAKKTDYVGTLSDGHTRGFGLLVLATPYRGRALPFSFVSYSSQTIAQESRSRNLEHQRALGEIADLVGETPVVLDREFSYEGLLEAFEAEGMKFVIRLGTGTRPSFTDEEGKRVTLSLAQGERVVGRGLYDKGKVEVNVAGEWKKGFKEPLWGITNLEPEEAVELYRERMKIDESFKDLKELLHLEKVMNKKREQMETMVALVLLAYAIGLLIGEAVRDRMYEEGDHTQSRSRSRGKKGGASSGSGRRGKRWRLYSGLFVLLKQKIRLGGEVIRRLVKEVVEGFRRLVWGPVRSYV